jgi:hypothetical protein
MENNSTPKDHLAHSHYDKLAMPGGITRFLWQCAGADKNILVNCTYADHVKYACLGGIVLATGVMAALAGGYAFYTIFQPKGSAISKDGIDAFTVILSLVFGIFWGLIIFNLDRFIISSTGKGDGTEAITASEFKNAIPRLVMGAVIALTISKPVEIRMFQSEINSKLHEKQMEQQSAYKLKTDAIFNSEIQNKEKEIAKFESALQEKIARHAELEKQYIEEARIITVGPRALAVKAQMESVEKEIKDVQNNPEYLRLKKEKDEIEKNREKAINESQAYSDNLDGLLERIKISHEIAGFWISLFITLLFMSIELAPIFFKLMMIKSPYDYLDENHKAIIIARHGVQKKGHLINQTNLTDGKGNLLNRAAELEYDVYLLADKLLEEKIKLLESELKIKHHIIEKHIDKKKSDIDANPDKYIEPEETEQNHKA